MKNAALFKFVVIIYVLIFGCSQNQTSLHGFNKNSWESKDSVIFYFDIADSTKIYNLSFFFRSTIEYPYRNIFLITSMSLEDEVIQTDTVEYLMADKHGRWHGKGFGQIRDNYFLFDEEMLFKKSGYYKFIIRHGMRQDPLIGANKLGFKIK